MKKCIGCTKKAIILESPIEALKTGFCSTSCAGKFRHRTGITKNLFVKGHQTRRGMKHSQKFIEGRKTTGNPAWKGDKVSKESLHCWIRDNFLRTNICEHCFKECKTDWSNKDHRYTSREREFWQELCRSCHQIYDFKFLGRTRSKKNKTL